MNNGIISVVSVEYQCTYAFPKEVQKRTGKKRYTEYRRVLLE